MRALAFGLVPEELRAQVGGDLVALIREAGTHLGTGFLATPFLLPVLADHGHLDVAYELLFQDTEPSWLADARPRCHNDLGGVGAASTPTAPSPLRSTTTARARSSRSCTATSPGVQIVEPGYRRFRVAPQPGGGITRACTHHDSPHGRIEVSWTLTGERGADRRDRAAGHEG